MLQWLILPYDSSSISWEPFFCCPGVSDAKFFKAGVLKSQEVHLRELPSS